MEEKQDLWELVRQKLEKNSEPETIGVPNDKPVKLAEEEVIRKDKKDPKQQTQINKVGSNYEIPKIEKINLLNQGVFAGFIYILSIMIILGILMIPGSITAAIGGYFGGTRYLGEVILNSITQYNFQYERRRIYVGRNSGGNSGGNIAMERAIITT